MSVNETELAAVTERIITFLNENYESAEIPEQVIEAIPLIKHNLGYIIDGKLTAILIERELRAPRWLSFVNKQSAVLEANNIQIGLITASEASSLILPKYPDIIRACSTKNFGLYNLRDDTLHCITNINLPSLWEQLNQERKEELLTRIGQNKHIPFVLTEVVKTLRNVFLSNTLRDIAVDYDLEAFDEPHAEYNFIQEAMSEILNIQQFSDLQDSLNFLRLSEKELQTKGKRDHFLHSFQVFLLGEYILDRFFHSFCGNNAESRNKLLILERTWLLASLYHDIGLPFQNMNWMNCPIDLNFTMVDDPRIDHILSDISNYYTSKTNLETNETLKNILIDIIKATNGKGKDEINHGLISAIIILKKTQNVNTQLYTREVMSAALAMAVHDRKVWTKLNDKNLLPLNITNFPITCLLILCDNLQSWGRPGFDSDPDGSNTKLNALNVLENTINIELCFEIVADGLAIKWEMVEILRKIIQIGDFFNVGLIQKK